MVFSGLRIRRSLWRSCDGKAALAATRAWRDHHKFTDRDVEILCDMATNYRAKSFLTTQKDMVRLTERQLMRLAETGPLAAAQLTVRLVPAGDGAGCA